MRKWIQLLNLTQKPKWPVHGYHLVTYLVMSDSFETPWTVAPQAPLSMGFPRQEYWSGLTFPCPGDLPDPGIEPTSLNSLLLSHQGRPAGT